MKQTAVEWLIEQIFNEIDLKDSILKLAINQAKEMEKEQIIESYCQGCWDITNNDIIFPRETSEQYYNETFKQQHDELRIKHD